MALNNLQVVKNLLDEQKVPRERQALILGQLKHESQSFKRLEENLNYSAKRLTEVFPNRFPTIESAKPYANNPAALAEKVYGGRKDLGNSEGEGYKYRGRGLVQLTGKNNYKKYGEELFLAGVLDDPNALVTNPDLLLSPKISAAASLAYLNDRAKNATTADEFTKAVNPGLFKRNNNESKRDIAKRKADTEAFAKQFKLSDAGVEIAVDGDWGKNSKNLWSKYGNAIDPSMPSVTSPDIEPEGIPSPLERRMQFAQTDPRRVDLAPQMAQAQAPAPENIEYASMDDLLMDKGLLGTSSFG